MSLPPLEPPLQPGAGHTGSSGVSACRARRPRRWWEARTHLGQLYINVRSLMRMTVAWLGPKQPHLVRSVYRWTTAIMPALCAYLRENPHYYAHLEGVLGDVEVDWLGARGIPPVAALQVGGRRGQVGSAWSGRPAGQRGRVRACEWQRGSSLGSNGSAAV